MTRTFRFTAWTIQTLRVSTGRDRAEYRDAEIPGLYVRVTGRGTKTFSFVRRAPGSGRMQRVTLGRFPQTSVDDARRQARHLAGLHTGSERSADRLPVSGAEITLSELRDRFLVQHGPASSSDRYRREFSSVFRRLIEPEFGQRVLASITRPEVSRWHARLPEAVRGRREALRQARESARRSGDASFRLAPGARTSPTAGLRSANYALSALRTLLDWAMREGLSGGDNPARGVSAHRLPRRERFLSNDEIARFHAALADEPHADFFLLALLTGANRAAVLAMRWPELDLGLGHWNIPATRSRPGQQVVLVPQAVEILQHRADRLRAGAGAGPRAEAGPWTGTQRYGAALEGFVFPSRSRSGHLADPHRAWRRVLVRAGLRDLRIRDLRRTLGVWQVAAGASVTIVARNLGQKTLQAGSQYARLARDPMRVAMERAADAMLPATRFRPARDEPASDRD